MIDSLSLSFPGWPQHNGLWTYYRFPALCPLLILCEFVTSTRFTGPLSDSSHSFLVYISGFTSCRFRLDDIDALGSKFVIDSQLRIHSKSPIFRCRLSAAKNISVADDVLPLSWSRYHSSGNVIPFFAVHCFKRSKNAIHDSDASFANTSSTIVLMYRLFHVVAMNFSNDSLAKGQKKRAGTQGVSHTR